MVPEGFPGLARYPSPVWRAELALEGAAELFIKDDGALRSDYGGNKIRKLERMLPHLAGQGARRILTIGPAGSHHVLATTLLARELGMSTAAVLFPQPWTEHAERTLRTSLALGLEPIPVTARALIPWAVARARRAGDALVPPGASNLRGAAGYVRAVEELAEQVRRGELPDPDVIVCAAGSAGTSAGLAAGIVLHGLPTRILAVDVGAAGLMAKGLVLALAAGLLRRAGRAAKIRALPRTVELDRDHRGAGYGVALPGFAGTRKRATAIGLTIEPTYTGKAFEAALDLAAHPELFPAWGVEQAGQARPLRVLYWHTLSRTFPEVGALPVLTTPLRELFAF